ncbi:Signal recognition particle subunit SRP72 [Basidiobolus ranarum]|uniref:Signal recognition particle subunit SRP72 n=1 Tax=Basidiobolus ranarum TaxID=34480 RepID=A0ABR2VSH7_9FUNG
MPDHDSLTLLFSELERLLNLVEYEKATKVCNKILKLNPEDRDALHVKIVTLIRLENYKEALKVFETTKNAEIKALVFEKAYCLYRDHQLEEALKIVRQALKETQSQEFSLRHLEAQITYRMEDYISCIEIYYNLLQEVSEQQEEYLDILTNYNAVKGAILMSGMKLDDKYAITDPCQTYELAFNSACIWVAKGDLGKAETLLETARSMCRVSLSGEDYTEEEIEQELSSIVIQLAYVYQMQGKTQQAVEMYSSVLKTKNADATVVAISANNLVAIKKKEDLFESVKKLRVATADNIQQKLFKSQRRIIAINNALLMLYMNKHGACRETVKKLISVYPDTDIPHLINASNHLAQKNVTKTLEELQAQAGDSSSLAIQFAIIQLQALQSNFTEALQTLEAYTNTLKDDIQKYRPGLVGLKVWLLEQSGQGEMGAKILNDACEIWQSVSDEHHPPAAIIKQTANFKLKSNRAEDAALDFEKLVRADPSDYQAIAGLIMSYAECKPSLAEKYESSLPPISGLLSHIDSDSLEVVVPGVKKSYVKKTLSKADSKKTANNEDKKLKKRKRKPLLPKNYDPSVTPDPERWLPKRERAAYRPKGKKKNLKGASQGSASAGGGGLGGTGSANIHGVAKTNSTPTAPVAAPTPSTQAPKPKSKPKKKKKGTKF